MTESKQLPIFIGHNDTLLSLYLPERGKGRSFFTRSDSGHIDLPRAREAGMMGGGKPQLPGFPPLLSCCLG